MNPLYVIDHSNFCYKFKSVYKFSKREVSGVQVDTSVLYGYLRVLKSNLFDNICIVLDGIPKNSLRLLPQYKGTRVKSDEVNLSIPRLEVIQFLTKVGSLLNKNVFVCASPGQEADQVIASISAMVSKEVDPFQALLASSTRESLSEDRMLRYLESSTTEDFKSDGYDSVVIGTTDSDMQQLMSPTVSIDSSLTGVGIRSFNDTASAVHGLPPAVIPMYKAIYGDVSDNVPTIVAFPLKRALSFLKTLVTKDQVQHLFNSIVNNTPYPPFEELIPLVYQAKLLFLRNWEVVHLGFVSVPYCLSFPSYDIRTTIEKYRLKV